MEFEIRTGSMKERLRSVEEIGAVMGMNGVEMPLDISAVIGKALYGTEERAATDRYLAARFREMWYRGSCDRTGNTVSIEEAAAIKKCLDDMRPVNSAFRMGEEFRYNGKSAIWIADTELFGIMDGKPEEFGQMCVDAWIAGWHFLDEEIRLGRVCGKPKKVLYRINADRLNDFAKYRENGSGPDGGDEEEYYEAYCRAAEKLEQEGEEELIECLTCPFTYRGLGVTMDECGKADWCDMDCAHVSRVMDDCCSTEVSMLSSYFVEREEEEEEE